MSGDRDPVVDAVVELARSVAHEKLGEAERHGAADPAKIRRQGTGDLADGA